MADAVKTRGAKSRHQESGDGSMVVVDVVLLVQDKRQKKRKKERKKERKKDKEKSGCTVYLVVIVGIQQISWEQQLLDIAKYPMRVHASSFVQ